MSKQRRPGRQGSTWEPTIVAPPPAGAVDPGAGAGADPVAEAPAARPAATDAAPPPPSPAVLPPVDSAEPEGPAAPHVRVRPNARRIAFSPERVDLRGIGETVAGYVRGEGTATLAHLRALGAARSPADAIRLQVGEVQRAADASLTCWSAVARKAARIVALR